MAKKLILYNLTKRYGKHTVFNNLNLSIDENEFFVILGPSGAGKSTLLKLIVGIEEPDNGRIFINGKEVTKLPPNKRNIAMVFQNYALYPNMTVFENIAFPLKMHHEPDIVKKVIAAAEKLNIADILKKNATKISGGQKQRVALARAIVRKPSLFLLDEPLSNLDARIRFSAREELKRIQMDVHDTFVFVTHDQGEAASLADRVAVLHAGRVEQIAPFSELYETPKSEWLGDFIGNYPMNFLPGEFAGEGNDLNVGFRAEWLEEDPAGIECTVQSYEVVGDIYYLFCKVGPDADLSQDADPENTVNRFTLVYKSAGRREYGEKLKLKITKYLKFRDGLLVQ